MKQVSVICCLFVLVCGFWLLVPSGSCAFDINTNATFEGDMSVNMSCVEGSSLGGATPQLKRYRFELDGRDGTGGVTNTYVPETGETGAGIGFTADPAAGLLGGRLSAEEELGANTLIPNKLCMGAAGSHFGVAELTSNTSGNLNNGTYAITAAGDTSRLAGAFGVSVAEKISTSDPNAYEDNIYQLEGEGDFTVSGEYGFGCGLPGGGG
jgi:hypothetical protein